MRIAFLTSEYVTESLFYGGLANYLYNVAVSLKKRGHDVEIFTASDKNKTIVHHEIVVHQIKSNSFWQRKLKAFFKHRLKILLNSTFDNIFLSYKINKQFQKTHQQKPFDIVQASSYKSVGFFIIRNKQTPIVTRVTSFETKIRVIYGWNLNLDNALSEWMEFFQMRNSNGLYAPSKLLAQLIPTYDPIRIDVINPPFFPVSLANLDESIYNQNLLNVSYLLFYGWISELKGVNFIWENLPEIFEQNEEIHFAFVGSGATPEINDSLKKYSHRIHVFEPLQHAQLFTVILNAKALVLPSKFDNLPNTCREAMYLKKVVVGTYGASFDEMIDHEKNGFLIHYGNNSELCQTINRICLMSQNELDEIGQNAHETILQKFNPEKQVIELENYFLKIIEAEKK